MKGLILVGGLGTQLRPLTLSKPKPLIEFANKPQLAHIIEMLVHAGVTEIVLAINYRKEIMQEFLDTCAAAILRRAILRNSSPPYTSQVPGPLRRQDHVLAGDGAARHGRADRAGAAAARRRRALLRDELRRRVPLLDEGLLDFHRAHGKVGTIMVTRVEEPAKYGKSVVLSHETGLIDRFVEHGRTYHGNWINAGVYIFSPSIFERIALRPTSMEREVLPELAADDQLYSRQLDGFWMNVKKPREWIEGNALYLSHLRTERPAALLAAGGGDGGDGGSSSGGGDSGKSQRSARRRRWRATC